MADAVAPPRLLGPDGSPIRVTDRRAVAKAGQVSGPTPAAITGGMLAEGMGSSSPFSPGQPIRPWGGYSQRPRGFDYPAGVNITSTPRSGYGKPSFATLRAIIDAYDIARICINHKIDSLRSLEGLFMPADGVDDDVEGPIKAARAALEYPDRERPFDAWLAKWLEGMFRYDAAALYRRRNRAGQVMALEVVDGTTITPFVDEYGRRPTPPAPAYTQVIKGTPHDWLTTDDLIYSPFRPQVDSPYGLAPIEAVMLTANTDLRLQWHMLNFFTAGSLPGGFLNAPADASTASQVQDWQDFWDALMIGDQEALRQIKVLPAGMKFTAGRDATYDENFALSMIRRTCAVYGVVPNDIGLTMDVNLANGETQTDVQFRVNDRPVMLFVQKILTAYLQRDLGLPVKFEFDDGQEKEDRLAEAQTWQVYIESGMASADEGRTALLGLPIDNERPVPRFFVSSRQGPIPLVDIMSITGPTDPQTGAPAADIPIPATQFPGDTGVVPDKLPADVNFTRAPVDIDDPRNPQDETGPVPSTAAIALPVAKEATAGVTADTGITGHDLIGQDDDDDEEPVLKAALTAEIGAFSRFCKARARDGRWRDFQFSTADDRTARRLNLLGRAQIRKAAGDLVAAGLAVLAADTGRVLMIQRAFDVTDPASGRLEFPGGHIDGDEDPAAAAAREWYEEVGLTVPIEGSLETGWTSANGVYQGFVYVIPCEAQVALDARNCGLNPDGDSFEACLWVDPADLPGNPLVRDELGADLDAVLEALTPADLVKAGGADPKAPAADTRRWHDVPVRKVMGATVDFHATKIAAATSGLLSTEKVRSLVEGYKAQVEGS